jgi:N-carbamoylputrescine amidase
VGQEGEFVFGGDSMIVDPSGEVLAAAGQKGDGIISARIDRAAVFSARRARPMFRDRRPDLYGPICTPTEVIPRID